MIKGRLSNLYGGNTLKDMARQVRAGTGDLVRMVETDDGVVEAGTGPIARGAGGGAGANTGNGTAKRRLMENGQRRGS